MIHGGFGGQLIQKTHAPMLGVPNAIQEFRLRTENGLKKMKLKRE